MAADAANWLLGNDGRRPADKPWLMAVNFVNPHDIMFFDATGTMAQERLDPIRVAPMKPEPYSAIYAEKLELELPTNFEDDLSTKPSAHRDDQRFADIMFGALPQENQDAWLNHRNYYYNCIRDVDRHIGCVLDALEKSGQADNTIVLFTSDHGEMAGSHGMRQKGPSMYKENVRVSLLIDHPDISQPLETESLGTSIDIAPTLLSLSGVIATDIETRWPALKGVSLEPALSYQTTARDERGMLLNYTTTLTWDTELIATLFAGQVRGEFTDAEKARLGQGFSLDNYSCFRGIHEGRYKFARYFKPSEHHQPADWETLTQHNELELYDTEQDPDELVNLASNAESHKPLITELNAKLNTLIDTEIGVDDGSCYPPGSNYQLQ
ncbi:MAG: sulfatase-like hydrolase/transferase [Pseudomonadota bacterium]